MDNDMFLGKNDDKTVEGGCLVLDFDEHGWASEVFTNKEGAFLLHERIKANDDYVSHLYSTHPEEHIMAMIEGREIVINYQIDVFYDGKFHEVSKDELIGKLATLLRDWSIHVLDTRMRIIA